MSVPIKSMLAAPILLSTVSQPKPADTAKLEETARQFESLLTKMMLKSMRDANKSFGESLFGSDQQDMYQDMFDDQLSLQLANGHGLGLAEMMVKQLARSSASLPAPSDSAPSLAPLGLAPLDLASSSAAPVSSTPSSSTPSSVDPMSAGPMSLAPPSATPPSAASVSSAVIGALQNTSKESFVNSLLPLAQEAARDLGVDPHALVAQAALETGWGRSVPVTASGASSNNLFGIKAGSNWSGATVNVPTLEFEGGIPVRKVERFRAYESAQDSFRDYAGLIGNSPRYAAAVDKGQDVAGFASALQQGGYATDPAYAQKMTRVANEVRGIAAGASFKLASSQPIHGIERKSS